MLNLYFQCAITMGGWKCRGDKIGYDLRTRHDTKLASYELRLNGFVSYSGDMTDQFNKRVRLVFNI